MKKLVITSHYQCDGCEKQFDTLGEALKCCPHEKKEIINTTYKPSQCIKCDAWFSYDTSATAFMFNEPSYCGDCYNGYLLENQTLGRARR